MPQPRINPNHIANLKAWMSANKDDLLAAGIDRIDAHYTDNDLSTGAFEDIQAYHVTDAGSRFTKIPFVGVSELNDLLEALAEGDAFFRGRQGGGGTFRLLLNSGTIEHASFEYVTAKLDHDVEVY